MASIDCDMSPAKHMCYVLWILSFVNFQLFSVICQLSTVPCSLFSVPCSLFSDICFQFSVLSFCFLISAICPLSSILHLFIPYTERQPYVIHPLSPVLLLLNLPYADKFLKFIVIVNDIIILIYCSFIYLDGSLNFVV